MFDERLCKKATSTLGKMGALGVLRLRPSQKAATDSAQDDGFRGHAIGLGGSILGMSGGYVYILGSSTGTLYIGVTSDIYLRILQHRNGAFEGFSKTYGCTRLLYVEPFELMLTAIAREKQLKGWRRNKKLDLIRKSNPEFKDLAGTWGWQMVNPGETIHP